MGQRLLIVDGDRRFIKDHQVALEAAFDVDFLYSTDGVLPLLENGDFAAVLICVEVSENKGYAICSAIRKNPKLVDLKVALISAKATEEEYARHRSLKGKADLYLHKPLISSALVASLTPLVPPVPGLWPMIRSTVFMWAKRHCWKRYSRSTSFSARSYRSQ